MSSCFLSSSVNGPIKMDGALTVERCFDCSRSGACEEQRVSHWPATTIAAGCTLPDAARDEPADEMPEILADVRGAPRHTLRRYLAALWHYLPYMPITDETMQSVIRSIALVSFKHTMPLGEWKRRMLAVEFPDIISQYVQSDWLLTRLENVVPREG